MAKNLSKDDSIKDLVYKIWESQARLEILKKEILYEGEPCEIPSLKGWRNPLKKVRKELELLKIKYYKNGGKPFEFCTSEAEWNAEDFQNSVSKITKIEYIFGDCFCGREAYSVEIEDDKIRLRDGMFEHFEDYDWCSLISAKEFLHKIADLHIGEWQSDFGPVGFKVLDGVQWEVTIEFKEGHSPVKYTGSNAYPYNFEDFVKLFDFTNLMSHRLPGKN